ncbi:VOC family protein [Kineococcus gynurae]|uniref:VOC family protein n=1 Tax=Kineococcus gynurae TaxID=452979 RepID=A0ABV5LT87_9ACTN
MSRRTAPWRPGVPCWFEVAASDPARSRAFYADVLGWSFTEDGADPTGRVDGRAAGAVVTEGPPGRILLHVAVDDVGATVTAAGAAGGSVLEPATDVEGQGRRAVLADPGGMPFAVWQAGGRIGAEVTGEPGSLVWEDLRSPDPDAARAFFAELFGWRYEVLPFPGAEGYTTFHLSAERSGSDAPSHPLGGIGPLWGFAPGWRVCLAVADPDAATTAATQAGGAVSDDPKDTPFGRIGEVRDPDGAVLAVMSTTGPEPVWD